MNSRKIRLEDGYLVHAPFKAMASRLKKWKKRKKRKMLLRNQNKLILGEGFGPLTFVFAFLSFWFFFFLH
jgi:hypothetical protein